MIAQGSTTPHTSCRYAVVLTEAFDELSSSGYVICAVHAIADGERVAMLVSRVSPGDVPLAFRAPEWVSRGYVARLCANFKDASATRARLVEQDHRAEMAPTCPNHPDRRATVSPRPGVYLCNDCAVDDQRAHYGEEGTR